MQDAGLGSFRFGWWRASLCLLAGAALGAGAVFLGADEDQPRSLPPLFGGSASDTSPGASAAAPRTTAGLAGQTFIEAARIPAPFARRRAFIEIAAAATADDIGMQVAEAGRIGVTERRVEALQIVLLRALELDAGLAVSLLNEQQAPYAQRLSLSVWETWARSDFDAALAAAAGQAYSKRHRIAEALYAAAGSLDSPEAQEIEAELGIPPSRELRRRYLNSLVDRSLEEALAYVSLMSSPLERREAIAWIAEYLSPAQLEQAAALPEGLLSASDRRALLMAVSVRRVEQDPAGLLERALMTGTERPSFEEISRALQLLVVEDVALAESFVARSRSNGNYVQLLSVFVTEFAAADPLAAIAWAKESDHQDVRGANLLLQALNSVAQSQPELAFDEALALSADGHDTILVNVFSLVARRDVALAQEMAARIPDPKMQRQAYRNLATQWAREHPEGALDWILAQEQELAKDLLGSARMMIMRVDIQTAIRNIHRLDTASQKQWRRQIVKQLAERGRVHEAQAFAGQFEAEADYSEMQTSIAVAAAKSDPELARTIAARLESPEARDRILAETLEYDSNLAATEIERQLLGISDPAVQFNKAREVYREWADDDPAGLSSWVRQQDPGPLKDAAIIGMITADVGLGAAQDELIASISVPDRRTEAKRIRIMRVMRSDPELALELAEDPDISDQDRLRLRRWIDRF
ncbi:MAG: hypothetical protein AAFX56_00925 [Pseudomonadota bacterium]